MEHAKFAKSNELCEQSLCFQIVPIPFLVTTKKLGSDLESLHFLTFSAKHHKCRIKRKMFMENQEIVMEKSWTNIFSSLWEP